jgi:hypothetical protein
MRFGSRKAFAVKGRCNDHSTCCPSLLKKANACSIEIDTLSGDFQ